MTTDTDPVVGSHRTPRPTARPRASLAGAARAATAVTAALLATLSVVAAVHAVRSWIAAGPAGIQDPDLNGLGAVLFSVAAVMTAVPALLALVATVQQGRATRRRAGVALAAVVHAPVALVAGRALLSAPDSSGPAGLVAAVLVVDAAVVWWAAAARQPAQ